MREVRNATVRIYKDPAKDDIAHMIARSISVHAPGSKVVLSERKPLEELLRPSTTALVVTDVQRGFCDSEVLFTMKGPGFTTRHIEEMAPRLAAFVEEARRHRVKVIWLRNDEEFGPGNPQFDYYRLAPIPGEKEIVERQAFDNPALEAYLVQNGITTVLCTGVYTSACVVGLAKSAVLIGQDAVLIPELVSDLNYTYHVDSLEFADVLTYVIPSSVIVREWARRSALST